MSKTSKPNDADWPGRRIDFQKFAADLARRRVALAGSPLLDTPRNSGKRRTASKRALLAAIAETGANW
ncbi:MAG: hypothetical protein WA979_05335 [Pacificimonas sp.]